MKIAVIGVGHWGKNLVRNFSDLGILAAVVDESQENLDWVIENYPKLEIFLEVKALLEKGGIDAVAIATPPHTHASIAHLAMDSGLDVFVEKPLTLEPQEAVALQAAAEAKGRILMVGHLLMYQPAIRFIKKSLSEGVLGEVYTLTQRRSKLGRVRSIENVLWSFGVHDVAVLLYLVGESPGEVKSSGHGAFTHDVADDVHLHLRFPSGIVANLHNSWFWPRVERELIITGSKGIIVFDELNSTVVLHRKMISADLNHHDEGEELLFEGSSQPLRLELEHFIECCKDRRTPLSDGQSGCDVVRVLNQAQSSL